MKNLTQMLKQAQDMQAKIADMQSALEAMEVEGQAAGGMVKVIVTGKGEMKKIDIDRSLLVPEEVAVLEDLIIAAFRDAKNRADSRAAEEMARLTGGMSLPPGFKLPF